MGAVDIARALFGAFEASDMAKVRSICCDDLVAWQNNQHRMSLDTLVKFSSLVADRVTSFRYEDVICVPTENGFVEEHRVRGTTPNGTELDLAICIVGVIEGDEIIELREYFDTACAAALADALR